ncbi:hypothetical protein M8T91_13455 [Microbulbifer spongiae]|uniref:Haemolysin-type calcium binding-related domain-containing protein n=1 Tax=Microbulbifer spongiae TaxID=2944933 RepID=A0ABY9EF47_9GAMM|nr:hypothetical protein M8T91_13455 [Microbulbifer sp. MI-G]
MKAIRTGNDLVLSVDAGSGSVTVANYFTAAGETVSLIGFADGTSWDSAQVRQLVLTGTEAADTIAGYESDDTLNGETGNDLLTGNGGSDTYLFSTGDGQDQIVTGEQDTATTETIRFDDTVMESSVSVGRSGNDIVLHYGAEDSVTVKNFFVAEGASVSAVDRVEFSSGTVWTLEDLKAKVLIGDAGSNTIEGYSSGDLLIGDTGNDTLRGGNGNDTYRFSAGDGADLIEDTAGEQDRIAFTDVNPEEVLLRRDGNDLVITNTTNSDTIRVRDQFATMAAVVSASGINSIAFADGSVWDYEQIKQGALAGTDSADDIFGHADGDNIHTGEGDDTVHGGLGNDRIYGELGADTLYGDAGDDTVFGGAGQDQLFGNSGNDEIHGGENADTIYGGNGNDLLHGDQGNDVIEDYSGVNTLYGGIGDDQLSGRGDLFGDAGADMLTGTGLLNGGDGDDHISGEGSDTLIGGAGNDVISAFSDAFTQNNNILEGGTGNDTLFGGFGDDEYRFNLGDGQDILTERRAGEDWSNVDASSDTIHFGVGISQADLEFERHNNDLHITHGNGTDAIRITDWYSGLTDHHKVNAIRFDDGSSLDLAGIESLVTTYGTSANDTLTGYRALSDSIRAGAGDDQVWGRNGDDILYGESGNDYLDGDAGDDRLDGGLGNDTLVGRVGSDTLVGGAGDDRYIYLPGSGKDVIDNSGGGVDRLFFNDGIGKDRLSFQRAGDDLLILVDDDSDQSVRVTNHFLGGDYAIDYVQPDGDFSIDAAAINQMVAAGGSSFDSIVEGTANGEQLAGTAANDQISGLAGDDTLFGLGGHDELLGGDGNDRLYGGNGTGSGSGDDTLIGGKGNDILSGGDGDDTLTGGLGDDHYYYGANGGVDTIDNSGGGTDWILFSDGITREQLSFHQEGEDLLILVDSDIDQQIRVVDHFLGGDNAISFVQPNDGGFAIMAASIPALIEALPTEGGGDTDGGGMTFDKVIEGTASAEQLVGTSDNDQIKGFEGGDTVFGLGGDDELLGGAGNDHLIGGNGSGSGSGNDTLFGGEGNDILSGEDGNDRLTGGLGDDHYYYGANGGIDTIDNTGGGFDGILFLDDIAREQLSFHQEGEDLLILVDSDMGQQVRVIDHFLGGDSAISFVQPNDGGFAISSSSFSGLLVPLPSEGASSSMDLAASEQIPVSEQEIVANQGLGAEQRLDLSSAADEAVHANIVDGLVNAMATLGGTSMGEAQFSRDMKDDAETVIACHFQVA